MDGAAVAADIIRDTARRAALYARAAGRRPCLAMVAVGDDPAAQTYVRMKTNRCEAAGLAPRTHHLTGDADTASVVRLVRGLSLDEGVDGIFVQYPFPPHVEARAVFEAIAPAKDVDGVTSASFAALALGGPGFVPATPGGIIRLLRAYDIDPARRHAVVVGTAPTLGQPVGMLLLAGAATVTYCHAATPDLPGLVRAGDIVVAAVGRPGFVRGDWIRPGAVVIDAGYFNPGNIGDVEYEAAAKRASHITPVPGGVGPATIAVLLANTVDAAISGLAAGQSADDGES